MFFGLAGSLSVTLSKGEYGSYETVCWCWGISFAMGIYTGGGVSGAHMNPCISLTFSAYRGFPIKMAGIYVLCQFAAALFAGGLAYCIYRDAIMHIDPEFKLTGGAFFANPQTFISPTTAFFNEFTAGAIMMVCVLALGDDSNNPPVSSV